MKAAAVPVLILLLLSTLLVACSATAESPSPQRSTPATGTGAPHPTPGPQPAARRLSFDGVGAYVEVPDSPALSVDPARGLTVAAWMRPATLTFPKTDGTGWVHWMGKGERSGATGQQEWALRMYSQGNTENRANRISFYVFNPEGGLGIGRYFQDPVQPGRWIHVVATVDPERKQTAIYKDGRLRDCDQYQPVAGSPAAPGGIACGTYPDLSILPREGTAPLRLGHRDGNSYFAGGLAEVRVWNRPLRAAEVAALYATGAAPREDLAAEYLLAEGAGPVARDTAGRHDGAIVGATWVPEPPSRT